MTVAWVAVWVGLALAFRALARPGAEGARRYSVLRDRLRPDPERMKECERRRRVARALLIHEAHRRATRGGQP